MFDEYLQKRASLRGEAFRPFDLATDYRLYVDGKPRFDGVRDFLSSRGIQLHEGNSADPAEVETVCGLGNRKNELINQIIADMGVEPYAGTVQFIHQLRRNGFKIAVVTSSQNCTTVLKAAKLDDFFEVRVDGNTIDAQGLAGKPAPDTFLIAAKLLGVEPIRTVVIEDLLKGLGGDGSTEDREPPTGSVRSPAAQASVARFAPRPATRPGYPPQLDAPNTFGTDKPGPRQSSASASDSQLREMKRAMETTAQDSNRSRMTPEALKEERIGMLRQKDPALGAAIDELDLELLD
jgi:HAD superfamily hydrolase (TIGR01509 family)